MSKRNKTNIFLLIIVILVIIVVYNIFAADKATAPETANNFQVQAEANSTVAPDKYQDISDNQIEAAVLMYHHVGSLPEKADNIRKGLTVSKEEFETQLKYLSEKNYKFLTLSELNKVIEKKEVPEKAVVLTFDDGYDDNFNDAWPIMKKYKAKGTFFIITSKIDKSEYMSKDQVKELYSAGNEIGSHSITHPSLEKLKGQALEKELKNSKEDLEILTGGKIVSFCFPAGKYNEETIKALVSNGYKMAVTTQSSTGSISLDQLLEIKRYRISPSMSFEARFR